MMKVSISHCTRWKVHRRI